MEPGHIDREDHCEARSRRRCPAGRNGARSYRPGGLVARHQTSVGPHAAMEPGHIDREDPPPPYPPSPSPPQPQWSPVISTGRTEEAPRAAALATTPQWSPVISTGRTRHRRQYPAERSRRNGARSYRPGGPPPQEPTTIIQWPQWSPVISTG